MEKVAITRRIRDTYQIETFGHSKSSIDSTFNYMEFNARVARLEKSGYKIAIEPLITSDRIH